MGFATKDARLKSDWRPKWQAGVAETERIRPVLRVRPWPAFSVRASAPHCYLGPQGGERRPWRG